MKKLTIADKDLMFRERIEMVSLLTTIRNQSKEEPIRAIIKTYFNSKYSLFTKLKTELPYWYRVVNNDLYDKLAAIPEDIVNMDDAINFLITFYYKNVNMSKAQEALTSEGKIIEDCNNANNR